MKKSRRNAHRAPVGSAGGKIVRGLACGPRTDHKDRLRFDLFFEVIAMCFLKAASEKKNIRVKIEPQKCLGFSRSTLSTITDTRKATNTILNDYTSGIQTHRHYRGRVEAVLKNNTDNLSKQRFLLARMAMINAAFTREYRKYREDRYRKSIGKPTRRGFNINVKPERYNGYISLREITGLTNVSRLVVTLSRGIKSYRDIPANRPMIWEELFPQTEMLDLNEQAIDARIAREEDLYRRSKKRPRPRDDGPETTKSEAVPRKRRRINDGTAKPLYRVTQAPQTLSEDEFSSSTASDSPERAVSPPRTNSSAYAVPHAIQQLPPLVCVTVRQPSPQTIPPNFTFMPPQSGAPRPRRRQRRAETHYSSLDLDLPRPPVIDSTPLGQPPGLFPPLLCGDFIPGTWIPYWHPLSVWFKPVEDHSARLYEQESPLPPGCGPAYSGGPQGPGLFNRTQAPPDADGDVAMFEDGMGELGVQEGTRNIFD